MNKKVNTALFILGATVVNILIMIILLVIGLAIVARIIPSDAGNGGQFAFLLVFLLSIAGSFFIYNRVIKLISKKIDMEKYFHPIFKTGKKKEGE